MRQVSDKDIWKQGAESYTGVEGVTKWEQGQMTNMKVEGRKSPRQIYRQTQTTSMDLHKPTRKEVSYRDGYGFLKYPKKKIISGSC